MIIKKISWNANLFAFFHWIIVGFLISCIDIKIKGTLKRVFISFITLIPIAFLVWWNDSSSIVPMIISTIIYGNLLGFAIDKYKDLF